MRKGHVFQHWIVLGITLFVLSCSKAQPIPQPPLIASSPFQSTPQLFPIATTLIDEASGMVISRRHPNLLWIIEDSFRPSSLHLLNTDGTYRKSIGIRSTLNRDWEELTLAKNPVDGKEYLYIADIGDNFGLFNEYFIHRVPEPDLSADSISVSTFKFVYEDGRHNAEAFVVDELTGDIYLFTKNASKCGVYRISGPLVSGQVSRANKILELPYGEITAACVNETELLIRNYKQIWYYVRRPGERIAATFQNPPAQVDYLPEPQGEAISFDRQNLGFYSISEKVNQPVQLQYYPKK
jgi:hypothetical protein